MEKEEFLASFTELVEIDAGTLTGEESLDGIEEWNSLAVLGFITIVHEHCEIALSPQSISQCKTINDLLQLLNDQASA